MPFSVKERGRRPHLSITLRFPQILTNQRRSQRRGLGRGPFFPISQVAKVDEDNRHDHGPAAMQNSTCPPPPFRSIGIRRHRCLPSTGPVRRLTSGGNLRPRAARSPMMRIKMMMMVTSLALLSLALSLSHTHSLTLDLHPAAEDLIPTIGMPGHRGFWRLMHAGTPWGDELAGLQAISDLRPSFSPFPLFGLDPGSIPPRCCHIFYDTGPTPT